ncbi:mRNA decay activator protein ZFP36L1 [Bagarius yarrelli]|uniref:mRNA decay activator protein ZFP36 n=1 Tax=Bagarius yarrelli TaxID=175774 RepID=A0A556V3V6_BAGYA|nr:mRNA decay activator protein ZFP36L1 [Bagarius yarrelli]
MPSNLLTPFLELDEEFCKTFQSLDVQDESRRAVGFQRRHSLCPVTLPNSKFNISGGAIEPSDDLWSFTSVSNQPWNREQLPRSALQRIPFRADRSVSMIEGHVGGECTLPPPPGLSITPPGLSISPPGLSVSPPSPRTAAVSAVSARYKTELCRTYEESGACKYGSKCQFAHGAEELRGLSRHPKYKTEPCRTFHTVGFCPYGARCHFIHNADEQQQQHRQATRERPRLLRQSVSFAGFPSRATMAAFQALPDQLAFTRAASVSPPPSSGFSCSPDLASPSVLPEHGALRHGFGFTADVALSDRIAALQRSASADSLSDHESYSSSGSLSGCDSPGADGSRRLPIFSRLSISDD